MTPEQKRIAIAEACGWKRKGKQKVWNIPHPGSGWEYVSGLPNYFNDLNAMNGAERWIIQRDILLWLKYSDELRRICDRAYGFACSAYHATAAQRADAFLLTLNLWKP